jgi:hypothetical protein
MCALPMSYFKGDAVFGARGASKRIYRAAGAAVPTG